MKTNDRSFRRRATLGAACAVTIAVAVDLLNRWDQRWRVSGREAATSLPGDDAVGDPKVRISRAIDIDVGVAEVWPWIVQLGADRGGFYSYDWLENLFGLDIHSADAIVQRWQDLAVGDLVRADRRGRGGWYVVALEPVDTIAMVLADVPAGRPAQRDRGGRWEFLWTFHLQCISDDRTRLLVRETVAFGRPRVRWMMSPFSVVSFVMTRRMLLGIKHRAETYPTAASERGGASRRIELPVTSDPLSIGGVGRVDELRDDP